MPKIRVGAQQDLKSDSLLDPEAIPQAVIDAFRERSTDLVAELERALEALWDHQTYYTHGL